MKLHCATLSLQHHYDVEKRYRKTMSLQSQYVIGLHRDENPTKTNSAIIWLAQGELATNASWCKKCNSNVDNVYT